MQKTSDLYKSLFADLLAGRGNVRFENRLAVGESGVLVDKTGTGITFGGVRILVDSGGPEGGYGEDMLFQDGLITKLNVFPGRAPAVGGCVSGEIVVEMEKPVAAIPKRSRLVPYVRLTDGTRTSEWIQKGVFYADTREVSPWGQLFSVQIHGYDALLKAEADYPPESKLSWPARDIDVVREIASALDVTVDSRTVAAMTMGYPIQYPAGYSQRETLGYIAAMYAGCFIMSDLGELLLVQLGGLPENTRYLVDNTRSAITFGGVRILV